MSYKLVHLKIKWQRLEICTEKTQASPGTLTPSRNQCRGFCHLLILFSLNQNKALISLTDQHMRYAWDVFSCQTHKHNKIRQQQWKRSQVSVHGLQTAASISIKTNSFEPLSLEPSLTDWRDMTTKTQIAKDGSSSLSSQVVNYSGEEPRGKGGIVFPHGDCRWETLIHFL